MRETNFIKAIYKVRVIAFAYSFVLCALLIYERDYGSIAYVLALIHFLGLPHLYYRRALGAIEPRSAELQHLLLDSLLFGAWIGGFEFPVWYLFSGFLGVVLANIVNRGIQGLAYSVIAFSIGALSLSTLNGFDLQPWTSPLLAVLCLIGIFVYSCAIGLLVYHSSKKLVLTQQQLRENEIHFRLITENAADLVALFDMEAHTIYASPSYRQHMGENDPLTEMDVLDHIYSEDRAEVYKALLIEANGTKAYALKYRMINAVGQTRYFNARTRAFLKEGKLCILLVSTDVTLVHEHDKQIRLSNEVMQNLAEAVMVWDVAGQVLSINKAYTKLTGFKTDDVIGKPEEDFRNALQAPEFYEEMAEQLRAHGKWRGSTWARRKNGSLYKERRRVNAIYDDNAKVILYVAIIYQIEKGVAVPDDLQTAQ